MQNHEANRGCRQLVRVDYRLCRWSDVGFSALALSLKPSNYRLVENEKHEVVICHDDKLVGVGYGGPLVTGDQPCPQGLGPSEAPVIETNNETEARLGLILVIVGFALQVPFAVKDVFSQPA